jgi:carbonic anhydrase
MALMRFLIPTAIVALALVVVPTTAGAQTFGYLGDIGPAHWGDLDPDWATCRDGDQQSPVDFGALTLLSKRLHHLSIDYGETEGEIFNNGHTIEVETEGDNTLWLDGIAYELVQFHFHTASEHRFSGRGFDMEMHLVHKSADGVNAVLGVFLKRGRSSGALAPIFEQLPDDLNVNHPLADSFNPKDFLPRDRTHYRYRGSLTTPPCSENVRWVVMAHPVLVSDEDMAQFAERIHFNARLVQRKLR